MQIVVRYKQDIGTGNQTEANKKQGTQGNSVNRQCVCERDSSQCDACKLSVNNVE